MIAERRGSAVFHSENDGWDRTSHLVASLGEQQAGLMNLRSRHPRPGVEYHEPQRLSSNEQPYNGVTLQVMTIDELKAKREKALADANQR